MREFSFSPGPEVIFGPGCSNKLDNVVQNMGAQKILLVSDDGLRQTDSPQKIIDVLNRSSIEVVSFFDVRPDPTASQVSSLAKKAVEDEIDVIVALGGGSVLDAAKACRILIAKNDDDIVEYEGYNTFSKTTLAPLVALPTTAGSGSEVTQWSVITSGGVKMGIGGKALYPNVTLADPQLTISCPENLTAHAGIDVLTHAIESYVSKRHNPISDILALEAVRLVLENLKRAVRVPDDIEARSEMLLASLLAARSFANADLGAVHCMAEALGGEKSIAHGLANALCLSEVILFNAKTAPERYARLAKETGLVKFDSEISTAVRTLLGEIDELLDAVSIDADIHATNREIVRLSKLAAQNLSVEGNPVDLREEDFQRMFEKVLKIHD